MIRLPFINLNRWRIKTKRYFTLKEYASFLQNRWNCNGYAGKVACLHVLNWWKILNPKIWIFAHGALYYLSSKYFKKRKFVQFPKWNNVLIKVNDYTLFGVKTITINKHMYNANKQLVPLIPFHTRTRTSKVDSFFFCFQFCFCYLKLFHLMIKKWEDETPGNDW